MNRGSLENVATEIIQVRDVPTADVDVLRARAAEQSTSLSAYLRSLIHDDASRPTMADVLARIGTRTRVEANTEVVRGFIEDGRRG